MSSPRKQPAPVQRRARRQVAAPEPSNKKRIGIASVAAVVLLLGGWYAYTNRTISLEDRGERFVELWNEEGLPGLVELYRWPDRESAGAMCRHIAGTRGWEEGAPPLAGPALREDQADGQAQLVFQLAGEPLTSTWTPEGKSWRLVELRLPLAGLDQRFEALWKSAGLEAVAALCTISKREDQSRAFAKVARNRGWSPDPPALTPAGTRETLADGRVRIEYAVGEESTESFDSIWAHTEGAWALVDLALPFGGLAESLKSAWNASDLERVGDFYSSSDKGVRAMQTVMKMRAWEELPKIESYELDRTSDEEVWMNAETEIGPLQARFRIKDGRWSLSSIKPPE